MVGPAGSLPGALSAPRPHSPLGHTVLPFCPHHRFNSSRLLIQKAWPIPGMTIQSSPYVTYLMGLECIPCLPQTNIYCPAMVSRCCDSTVGIKPRSLHQENSPSQTRGAPIQHGKCLWEPRRTQPGMGDGQGASGRTWGLPHVESKGRDWIW